jgi:hypothetical protein
MTRFRTTLATLLAATFVAGSAPQLAQAAFTAADAAMQERSQLFVNTNSAITDLLAAMNAYSIARAHDMQGAMHVAAAVMAGASSEAAYLAAVLNAQVQTEGTSDKAKELAPQLAKLTAQVETALDSIVASGNLEELNKILDSSETASALTELARINREVHQLIWG